MGLRKGTDRNYILRVYDKSCALVGKNGRGKKPEA